MGVLPSVTQYADRSPGTPGIHGLSVVEIEVCSRCNRSCSYCPVSLNPRPAVPVRMPDEVFQAVVGQLAEIPFAGRISYHLYNEPLLHTGLATMVATVDSRLPDALQILNTNGDLLDGRRYTSLREAGIDYFYVTRHSEGPYPERPFQVVQTSSDLILTNRGGSLVHLPTPTADAARTPCHAPSEMLVVTVDGDVLLCYEDAHREHVLGNVLTSSIAEIWNDERQVATRRRLESGDRSGCGMCTACSNTSHSRPGLSALETPILTAGGLTREDDAVPALKRLSRSARREPATGEPV